MTSKSKCCFGNINLRPQKKAFWYSREVVKTSEDLEIVLKKSQQKDETLIRICIKPLRLWWEQVLMELDYKKTSSERCVSSLRDIDQSCIILNERYF